MNDKIKEIEKKIETNRLELSALNDSLVEECYKFMGEVGIKKGSLVSVKSFGDRIEQGVLTHLRLEYGKVMPVVMKVKKDGTPHGKAHVYCYDMNSVVELKGSAKKH